MRSPEQSAWLIELTPTASVGKCCGSNKASAAQSRAAVRVNTAAPRGGVYCDVPPVVSWEGRAVRNRGRAVASLTLFLGPAATLALYKSHSCRNTHHLLTPWCSPLVPAPSGSFYFCPQVQLGLCDQILTEDTLTQKCVCVHTNFLEWDVCFREVICMRWQQRSHIVVLID